MTFLLLHAIGSHAGAHWQQWLHDELIADGHVVIMPNLPEADHPDRQIWLDTVKEITEELDLSDLVIIGHSLGATTALDFIEQSTSPVKAFISVAGFGVDYGAELNSYFLAKRNINFDKVNAHLQKAIVIYGDNDPYVAPEALRHLATALKVEPMVIKNGKHLNTEAGYTEFPELLKISKRI